jgi:hypothetical protein
MMVARQILRWPKEEEEMPEDDFIELPEEKSIDELMIEASAAATSVTGNPRYEWCRHVAERTLGRILMLRQALKLTDEEMVAMLRPFFVRYGSELSDVGGASYDRIIDSEEEVVTELDREVLRQVRKGEL